MTSQDQGSSSVAFSLPGAAWATIPRLAGSRRRNNLAQAYAHAAARLATVMVATGMAKTGIKASRANVLAEWARRWPHQDSKARSNRMKNGIEVLDGNGWLDSTGEDLAVRDQEMIHRIADGLPWMEDQYGVSLLRTPGGIHLTRDSQVQGCPKFPKKLLFRSEGEALRYLHSRWGPGKSIMDKSLWPYQCPGCPGWHLTSKGHHSAHRRS